MIAKEEQQQQFRTPKCTRRLTLLYPSTITVLFTSLCCPFIFGYSAALLDVGL